MKRTLRKVGSLVSVLTLRDARLKLKRAEKHIDDLNTVLNGFIHLHPYKAVAKAHPHQQAWPIWVAAVTQQTPEELPLLIGDAVHNLRSALDLAVSDIIRRHGKSDNRVYFPTAASQDRLQSAIDEGLKGRAGAKTVGAIEFIEPYPGGRCGELRALHTLDIMDKHRLIVPVAYGLDLHTLPKGHTTHPVGLAHSVRVEPIVNNAIVLDTPTFNGKHEVGDEADLAFAIEFDIGTPVEGREVVPTLKAMAADVECALTFLEPCLV